MQKLLEELEDAATSEMVWIVTEDFVEPVAYANAVVNAFAAKCGEACTVSSAGTPRPGPEDDPTLVYVWGAVRDALEVTLDAAIPVLRRQEPGFYRF